MRLQTSYEVSEEEKTAMEFTVLKLLQLDEIPIGASPNLRRRLNSKLVISRTSNATEAKLTLGPSRSSTRSNQVGYEQSKLLYQSMFFADMNVEFWLDEEIKAHSCENVTDPVTFFLKMSYRGYILFPIRFHSNFF